MSRSLLLITMLSLSAPLQEARAVIPVVKVNPRYLKDHPGFIEITHADRKKQAEFTLQLRLTVPTFVATGLHVKRPDESQEVFATQSESRSGHMTVRFAIPEVSIPMAVFSFDVGGRGPKQHAIEPPGGHGSTVYEIELRHFVGQTNSQAEVTKEKTEQGASATGGSSAEKSTTDQRVYSPKEIIARGEELMSSNPPQEVTVRFKVGSVKDVLIRNVDGSKRHELHPYQLHGSKRHELHLLPDDYGDAVGNYFSAPVHRKAVEQLNEIGFEDISKYFVGRTVTLRGHVTRTATQLYDSPVFWTYHIDMKSLDQKTLDNLLSRGSSEKSDEASTTMPQDPPLLPSNKSIQKVDPPATSPRDGMPLVAQSPELPTPMEKSDQGAGGTAAEKSTTDQRVDSPKEIIARGEELMATNPPQEVTVRFTVRSVMKVPTQYADGSKQQALHLVPDDYGDQVGNNFTAPIDRKFVEQLKRIGIEDISEHFAGRTITLRGNVVGTATDLLESPTIWTFHVEMRSFDNVMSVTSSETEISSEESSTVAPPNTDTPSR